MQPKISTQLGVSIDASTNRGGGACGEPGGGSGLGGGFGGTSGGEAGTERQLVSAPRSLQ